MFLDKNLKPKSDSTGRTESVLKHDLGPRVLAVYLVRYRIIKCDLFKVAEDPASRTELPDSATTAE